MKSKARAYVVGAYVPNGGTFMAYHLGQILQAEFDLEAVAVTLGSESHENGIHRYSPPYRSVTIAEMQDMISDQDVLICNPSFSALMFGLHLPGTKICYVQGFNTFPILDCRFDHYVAVSGFVSTFLPTVYGLKTRVIPPFIDLACFPPTIPWHERPAGSTYVHLKGDASFIHPLFGRLQAILADRAPEIALQPAAQGAFVPQVDLLRHIGNHRYFLTLAISEGFGLVPLEAMAMGATVIGFDGFGGREYMQPDVNCAVAPYPDIEAVADKLIAVTRASELGAALAARGRTTAEAYTYDAFAAAWRQEFSRCLDAAPLRQRSAARSSLG